MPVSLVLCLATSSLVYRGRLSAAAASSGAGAGASAFSGAGAAGAALDAEAVTVGARSALDPPNMDPTPATPPNPRANAAAFLHVLLLSWPEAEVNGWELRALTSWGATTAADELAALSPSSSARDCIIWPGSLAVRHFLPAPLVARLALYGKQNEFKQ